MSTVARIIQAVTSNKIISAVITAANGQKKTSVDTNTNVKSQNQKLNNDDRYVYSYNVRNNLTGKDEERQISVYASSHEEAYQKVLGHLLEPIDIDEVKHLPLYDAPYSLFEGRNVF